jgi:aspartyl-tRNA(Asn)/glutamyl-tRNA(Gln) amidotransferase subunit C
MALTLDEVRKIAKLARLRLGPEAEEKLVHQLGEVVDYIDQLEGFPVAAAEGDAAAAPGFEAEDREGECLAQSIFLANAPATMEPFLVVPEVKASDDE